MLSPKRCKSHPAEPPIALFKFVQCGGKIFLGKIRPQNIGIPKFRIRRLPQQEVGQPVFPARAYNQIGIGKTACIQVFGNHFLGNLRRFKFPFFHFFGGQWFISLKFALFVTVQRGTRFLVVQSLGSFSFPYARFTHTAK